MKHLILICCIFLFSCQNTENQANELTENSDSITLNLPLLESSNISNSKPSKDTVFFPPTGFDWSESWHAKIKNSTDSIYIQKSFSTSDGVSKVSLNGTVYYFFEIEYLLKYKDQTKEIKKHQFKNAISEDFYKNVRLETLVTEAYTQNNQIFMDFGLCDIPEYGDSCIFIPTVIF